MCHFRSNGKRDKKRRAWFVNTMCVESEYMKIHTFMNFHIFTFILFPQRVYNEFTQ